MTDLVFKALADPTRRQILRTLGDGEMSAGELARQFPMRAPSMSHHFNVLKGAGLLTSRKDGQQIFYSVETTVVQQLLASLLDILGQGPTTGHGGDNTDGIA